MKLNSSSVLKAMAFVLALNVQSACAQVINIVAGNGVSGYAGDGGLAIDAELSLSDFLASTGSGIVIDHSGNMIIADEFNNVIRKVNTSGVISTIVGTGYGAGSGGFTGGYSGDGMAATAAELFTPAGVAIDAAGNIYIADQMNARIRKVNTSGIISTIAGNGSYGFAGVGGPATDATLGQPNSVAVDASGNIYFADAQNYVVWKVNTSGIISIFAGVPGSSGFISEDVPATNCMLASPWGIAFDASGNVYFADYGNNYVLKVNSSGIITSAAGNGSGGAFGGDGVMATATTVAEPRGIAFDPAGNYYIAEGDNRIRKVNTAGITSTVAGTGTGGFSGDGGAATLAELSFPIGVALDAAGNIYIVDEDNDVIREVFSGELQAKNIPTQVSGITLYPNPNQGTFTFNLTSGTDEQAQITITNMIGEKVKELTTTTNKNTDIKVEGGPGIYFISATTGHGNYVAKVVVE